MKRYRAVDVPPKFRRTVKGRNARLGESVYFNRFFSTYNLVYLKFFLMWVGCITLDFLIGFRFELLWPVWLLVRHLYESFRVHAFSSSLHYSAFSVFFVCVTATSDLVCYLFIPIQVLIFLASTYVWVQFVYQSSDRGICLPSLFLWALFIVFEYSVRYRFDNATWYLARTSWITAGLFPSTADSVSVGSSSPAPSASSTRLELYRPFAAHCIGFPVVTLGFRVKSFFSNWRMRIRREEVRRQNEFYERILADAIPTSFENRKHFISSRSHLSIEQQEAIEYDSGSYATSELLSGLDANGQPRLYVANPATLAAICGPTITPTSSQSTFHPQQNPQNLTQQTPNSSAASLALLKKQQRLTKQSTSTLLKHQNGIGGAAKKNGAAGGKFGGGTTMFKQSQLMVCGQQNSGTADVLLSRDETILHKIWRTTFRFCCLSVLSTFGHLISALLPSFQQSLEGLISQIRGSASLSQDDLISTSGDGSNVADEDDWEHESNHFHAGHSELHGNLLQGGKRKSRRQRGLSTLSQMSTALNDHQQQQQPMGGGSLKTTASNSSSVYTSNGIQQQTRAEGDIVLAATHQHEQSGENNDEQLIRENALKQSELKQLQKEKQILEQSFDKLKAELKLSRQSETELRQQLQLARQQDQICRNEWSQLERDQKAKMDQLESKCRQLGKQNEHFKTNIQALEKRVGELQLKKLEIERELANERLVVKQQQQQHSDQHAGKNMQENGEHFKQKLANMDRELKQLKREMKIKDELCGKMDEEMRQLHSANSDESKQIEALKQKNFVLEQTLSAENRLKQDLFRALNDSKAEIASIKSELRANKSKEQADMMIAFSASNSLFHNTAGGGSSSGSSPTQQQPSQRFPLSQQKSLTPPPLSVGSSTFNLEQLLQATQNMSYSLGPIDANGGLSQQNENSYATQLHYGNGTTTAVGTSSSSYIGGEVSEMLAVGGHRAAANNAGGAKNSSIGGN